MKRNQRIKELREMFLQLAEIYINSIEQEKPVKELVELKDMLRKIQAELATLEEDVKTS